MMAKLQQYWIFKKLIPATFPDLVTLECGKYAVRRGDSTAHPHSHMLERVSWR
jgi:hypothetical protein